MRNLDGLIYDIEDSIRQIEKLNEYNLDNLERQYGWDELRDKDPILVCHDIQEHINEINETINYIRDKLER